METRQLRHFVVLAETLNYRRAAELLHITQPPLSSSIRKLEERLGVPLFERSRRGTALTAAGSAALEHARVALQSIDRFRRSAQAVSAAGASQLRVAFVGSATCSLMPRLLPAYAQRYPEMQLDLRDATSSEILELVEREEVDVGLVRVPLSHDTPVRLLNLEEDHFVAALPAQHALARQPHLALADLAQENFIFYAQDAVPGLHASAMQACRSACFTPRIRQSAVKVQTVVSLVESGLGVALVPSVVAQHGHPNVVFRALHDLADSAAIGLALAYLPGRESAAARCFIDMALLACATQEAAAPAQEAALQSYLMLARLTTPDHSAKSLRMVRA